MERVKGIEP